MGMERNSCIYATSGDVLWLLGVKVAMLLDVWENEPQQAIR